MGDKKLKVLIISAEYSSNWEIILPNEKKNAVKCLSCLNDVFYQNRYDHECPISSAEGNLFSKFII